MIRKSPTKKQISAAWSALSKGTVSNQQWSILYFDLFAEFPTVPKKEK